MFAPARAVAVNAAHPSGVCVRRGRIDSMRMLTCGIRREPETGLSRGESLYRSDRVPRVAARVHRRAIRSIRIPTRAQVDAAEKASTVVGKIEGGGAIPLSVGLADREEQSREILAIDFRAIAEEPALGNGLRRTCERDYRTGSGGQGSLESFDAVGDSVIAGVPLRPRGKLLDEGKRGYYRQHEKDA